MAGVSLKQDLIPKGRKYGRPATKLHTPSFVTVHNTGNWEATAENHADYLKKPNRSPQSSWHMTVDWDSAVQSIPFDEQAWHAGTTAGNVASIGVEVCMSKDKKKAAAAEENAAFIVAWICVRRGIPLSRVKPHKYWSGKNCPQVILPHWDKFMARVKHHYDALRLNEKGDRPASPLIHKQEFFWVLIHTDEAGLKAYEAEAKEQRDALISKSTKRETARNISLEIKKVY